MAKLDAKRRAVVAAPLVAQARQDGLPDHLVWQVIALTITDMCKSSREDATVIQHSACSSCGVIRGASLARQVANARRLHFG